MALAPKPEPAGKRTRGRVMSGDAAAAEARIMEGLAREAAGLGVEIVDVAGNIEDVSARVAQQARSFTGLVASAGAVNRTEESRVGKACDSTWRSRGSRSHYKKKQMNQHNNKN